MFGNVETKLDIISREARNTLANSDNFVNVNIFTDRTIKERDERRKLAAIKDQKYGILLQEGTIDKRWIIRRGKLQEVYPSKQIPANPQLPPKPLTPPRLRVN